MKRIKTLIKNAAIFLFLLLGTAMIFAQTAVPAQNIAGAPVQPFGKTLFTIYGNIGSVTAEKRAAIISDNIKKLKKDMLYRSSDLEISPDDGTENIIYKGSVILGVSDKQALINGKTKAETAQEYRAIIINTLQKERAGNMWLIILKQLGLASMIAVIAYLAIRYTNILYRYLNGLILKKKDKAQEALHNIIDVNKQTRLIIALIKILRVAFIAFIVFICALAFLALFPGTYWLAGKLLSLITIPLKKVSLAIWNYMPNLIMIAIIIILFRIVSKVLRIVADRIASSNMDIKGFHPDWAIPTYHIIWLLLLIFTVIFIFPLLPNSNSGVFKGISVFLGVLLSLGSTSIINNIVSGFVITYMRPFKVGDRIKMGEHLGNVIEKSSLVTRLRTPKNEIVTIPNSTIMTANTINYTNSANNYGLILSAKLTVGYEVEWRKVHELLISAGLQTQGVLQDPKPFVLQAMLDDFYVQYELNVYTDKADEMAKIYSALNENIQDTFNTTGIELASPHMSYVRDGSTIFMPKSYIKPEIAKYPPFRVSVEHEK